MVGWARFFKLLSLTSALFTAHVHAKRDASQLVSLMSGGISGSISLTLTSPIEVVKTQLQGSSNAGSSPINVAKTIFKQDGLQGFWRGLTPSLIGIFPARASYFWAYSTTKQSLLERFGDSPITHTLAALAAGVTSNTITNPIWMVKTRVQLLADTSRGQVAYAGYRDAVRSIWAEEGFAGFYKGLSASYWGCAEGCIQFVAYEKLKSKLIERYNALREAKGLPAADSLPPVQYLGAAGLSKLMGTIATYPHEVARTRLREQARNGLFKYNGGMWQCLATIAKEEGRQGLYGGMGAHVLRVVPNTVSVLLLVITSRSRTSDVTHSLTHLLSNFFLSSGHHVPKL
ncbi:unnamed protein product [Chrysoparadoxa australica]